MLRGAIGRGKEGRNPAAPDQRVMSKMSQTEGAKRCRIARGCGIREPGSAARSGRLPAGAWARGEGARRAKCGSVQRRGDAPWRGDPARGDCSGGRRAGSRQVPSGQTQ